MRIAIISDSHDNLTNIYKALDWMNKNGVSEIIHCGDVCASSALAEIAKNFKGKIHLVYGNVDGDHEGMEKMAEKAGNIVICGEAGILEISRDEGEVVEPRFQEISRDEGEVVEPYLQEGGVPKPRYKIAFTHFPWKAKELAKSGKYKYIFYGHTHKPWEEKVGNCKMINPGTLAGMFYKATFAVFDTNTGQLDLKLLERL
ncbi:MAG: metallophosphoesterase family protein [bacterium]